MVKLVSDFLNKIGEVFRSKDSGPYLKGPELASKSGKTKYLMIGFHGYGSEGENLFHIAPFFQNAFEDLHFIAPNGIEAYENDSRFFQWGSLADLEEDKLYEELSRASLKVNQYIDSQLKRFNLTDENLILLGFSQGAYLALHLGLRRSKKPMAILAFSGGFVNVKDRNDEIKVRPNVGLFHGTNDDVVPYIRMDEASKDLKALKVPVKTFPIYDVYHSINKTGVDFAIKFLEGIMFDSKKL